MDFPFLATFLVFASFAAAQFDPQPVHVITPADGDVVNLDNNYTITWTPTPEGSESSTIEVVKNNKTEGYFGNGFSTTAGQYKCVVGDPFCDGPPAGTGYRLKFVGFYDGELLGESGEFTVVYSASPSASSTAHTTSSASGSQTANTGSATTTPSFPKNPAQGASGGLSSGAKAGIGAGAAALGITLLALLVFILHRRGKKQKQQVKQFNGSAGAAVPFEKAELYGSGNIIQYSYPSTNHTHHGAHDTQYPMPELEASKTRYHSVAELPP